MLCSLARCHPKSISNVHSAAREQCSLALCTLQVELQTSVPLTFSNPSALTAGNTRTSAGTYLAAADMLSTGNFTVSAATAVSSSTGCGFATSSSLGIAVLVLSFDATVSAVLRL